MNPATNDLILRAMTLDDVPAVAAIDRALFPLPWSEGSFRSDLTVNSAANLIVAERTDGHAAAIAGYIGYWLVIDEAHLSTLAVVPDLRRRGIGERLLGEAMRRAVRQGAEMMTLEVRVSNDVARRLYEKHGFHLVGRRRHYYRDNLEDALLMTRDDLSREVEGTEAGRHGS